MNNDPATQSAIHWALMHGLALKTGEGSADHCAFSFAPVQIDREHFAQLKQAVALMGKIIHAVSESHEFLRESLEPLEDSDCLFGHLLKLHRQIHDKKAKALRQPLLIMRTDFMDDVQAGPKVIEFNGIAAGMGPFGGKVHQLHHYLQQTTPDEFNYWAGSDQFELVPNDATSQLAKGIAESAITVRKQSGESGQPVFLMVVQPDEDNVYDQKLLELALHKLGVKAVRRTFRQLHDELSTGDNNRLHLKAVGHLDVVYLRAGYQPEDYIAHDLEEARCCESLGQTRAFIEQHYVAVNATISQQLATSKRVQMLLTSMTEEQLTVFNLTLEEARIVKGFLGEMNPVNSQSSKWFKQQLPSEWVLKNQGEGGGHCIFGDDIAPKLQSLDLHPEHYHSWALMRRLCPLPRKAPALLVRKGKGAQVNDLISEIGLFTVHFNGESVTSENGYAGYLVRSKPAGVSEGGVHSGMGVLDSLAY